MWIDVHRRTHTGGIMEWISYYNHYCSASNLFKLKSCLLFRLYDSLSNTIERKHFSGSLYPTPTTCYRSISFHWTFGIILSIFVLQEQVCTRIYDTMMMWTLKLFASRSRNKHETNRNGRMRIHSVRNIIKRCCKKEPIRWIVSIHDTTAAAAAVHGTSCCLTHKQYQYCLPAGWVPVKMYHANLAQSCAHTTSQSVVAGVPFERQPNSARLYSAIRSFVRWLVDIACGKLHKYAWQAMKFMLDARIFYIT